jgi:ribose/xylose/arabinose/galactoside ABC-type transport system permease subunit
MKKAGQMRSTPSFAAGSTPSASRARLQISKLTAARGLGVLLLAGFAVFTPGFASAPSLLSLLTTVSFVGCVAVGMTLITISGNIMSFNLGATAGASAMIFILGMNAGGPLAGAAAALAVGGLINAAQGFLIGYVRANPIIVSIAAFALITGFGEAFAQRGTIYLAHPAAAAWLHFQLGVVPSEFVVFLGLTLLAQIMLGYTVFGRRVYMLGSSFRAAEAAGIRPWRTVTGVYLCAGLCAAVAGALLAIRYNAADMTYGVGYDYDAVAAVLVGGTLMRGGAGSAWRTLFGALFIAVVQILLLLRGFREEWQYLFSGLIVFIAVLLQPRRGDVR